MSLQEVYFWTSTVKDWKLLLKQDKYKEYIIDVMKRQIEKQLYKLSGPPSQHFTSKYIVIK